MKMSPEQKKFYQLREESVKNSCHEIKKEKEEYQKIKKGNPIYSFTKSLKKVSIYDLALEELYWHGFPKDGKATKYLATLITIFYHERELYAKTRKNHREYWNLRSWDNKHYQMLGQNNELLIKEITNALKNNKEEKRNLEEIVYDTADYFGYYQNKAESQYIELIRKPKGRKG